MELLHFYENMAKILATILENLFKVIYIDGPYLVICELGILELENGNLQK
jgi:hypothetical protein